MLRLESDEGVAQAQLRSLMSDMGVESGLWSLPDYSEPSRKYFPFIMPVADLDHGLHHCMAETSFAYDSNVWALYFKQLNGLAKLFSRRETVDRFVKFQIWDNDRIPKEAKSSLAVIFKTTCPTLCPHRWMLEFEILNWLSEREGMLKFLEPDIVKANETISQDEGNALKQLIDDPKAAAHFWAMAWVELQIHRWGFSVYDWIHRCPCHTKTENQSLSTPCRWNGRRLMEISSGRFEAGRLFYESEQVDII